MNYALVVLLTILLQGTKAGNEKADIQVREIQDDSREFIYASYTPQHSQKEHTTERFNYKDAVQQDPRQLRYINQQQVDVLRTAKNFRTKYRETREPLPDISAQVDKKFDNSDQVGQFLQPKRSKLVYVRSASFRHQFDSPLGNNENTLEQPEMNLKDFDALKKLLEQHPNAQIPGLERRLRNPEVDRINSSHIQVDTPEDVNTLRNILRQENSARLNDLKEFLLQLEEREHIESAPSEPIIFEKVGTSTTAPDEISRLEKGTPEENLGIPMTILEENVEKSKTIPVQEQNYDTPYYTENQIAEIQAQLDETAKLQAQEALNRAQIRAKYHVEAQHRALAFLREHLQQTALKNFREQTIDTPQIKSAVIKTTTDRQQESNITPKIKKQRQVHAIKYAIEENVAKPIKLRTTEANSHKRESTPSNKQYAARYAFGYRVASWKERNDFGHEEHRDGRMTKGHYHVFLPDGRLQKVDYYADETGYHAIISYENVGMKN